CPAWIHKLIFEYIGLDWIYLLVLGIIMALLSFLIDYCITQIQHAHILAYQSAKHSGFLQYLAWVFLPMIFLLFSVGFVKLCSIHAIGSGIPEMKTIMRGYSLHHYLSFRALIAKSVGLIAAAGSGMPIGKEGPFVHIASIVASIMNRILGVFRGLYKNESHNMDLLAAACAVGVSSNFAAPIGGVLFSIEVTSTHFAVRNYWRGFFSAVCGAFVFRLLSVWDREEQTITALFSTHFRVDFPFDMTEMLAFIFIGIVSGFSGALFVYLHRKLIELRRKYRKNVVSKFFRKSIFLYPAIICFIYFSLTFPLGLGRYMASIVTPKEAIDELFSNATWYRGHADNIKAQKILDHWDHPNIYVSLLLFIIFQFFWTAASVALPIPCGVVLPVFIIGAAFGRLIGEAMAAWFPLGIRSGDGLFSPIVPGGYAVIGAAALAGSVTHTISVSVIVFELTGQIVHIIPVMVAVLISNAIATKLQPSFYDSIIQIKKLPYLPEIYEDKAYDIYVSDIMRTDIKYLSYKSSYEDLDKLLETTKLKSFPLVESADSMVLLGSLQRKQLEGLLARYINKVAQEVSTSQPTTEPKRDQLESTVNDENEDNHKDGAE
ncbi:uncharacterized protein TRIADDRAFT_26270, partial [Trichoplax adhaerens]